MFSYITVVQLELSPTTQFSPYTSRQGRVTWSCSGGARQVKSRQRWSPQRSRQLALQGNCVEYSVSRSAGYVTSKMNATWQLGDQWQQDDRNNSTISFTEELCAKQCMWVSRSNHTSSTSSPSKSLLSRIPQKLLNHGPTPLLTLTLVLSHYIRPCTNCTMKMLAYLWRWFQNFSLHRRFFQFLSRSGCHPSALLLSDQ